MKKYSIEDLEILMPGSWQQINKYVYQLFCGDYNIYYFPFEGEFDINDCAKDQHVENSSLDKVLLFYKKHFKLKNFT